MYRSSSVRVFGVATRLALAALVWVLALSGTGFAGKPAKPPGGGDDGTASYSVARIYFANSPRIKWDDQAFCMPLSRLGDPIWHYWDQHDTALAGQWPSNPEYGIETSVSGGGRLFFFTLGRIGVLPVEPDRWLVLDLTPTGADPAPYDDGDEETDYGPDIDTKVYPAGTLFAPPTNENTFVDNVKCTISLDVMFKKNTTRQPLSIQVRKPVPTGGWAPAGWSLHSVTDLYVVQKVGGDKNVRTLTTTNPQTGESDAEEFELWNEGVVVGRYCIPLKWIIRLVEVP